MSRWCEVFDDENVQLMTRRQAGVLAAGVGVMAALTAGVLLFGYLGLIAPQPFIAALTLVWMLAVLNVRSLVGGWRSGLWCVKLTADEVATFDFARRKSAVSWPEIRRVELTNQGISVVGPQAPSLQIPSEFSQFALLSHSLVEQAESNGVPVFIDGQPWQNVDVYAFFPELLAEAEN